jgi:hypothetical protein
MQAKIFLNYRRGDEPGYTQALYKYLELEFGHEVVFMDVEGYIKPGDDFEQVLSSQIAACDVLLAIIGPRWLDAKDDNGELRLANPNDFVRIEIISALEQGKRVMPVLVGGAVMPPADQLPLLLRPLVRRQAVRLTHERFQVDCQGLMKNVRQVLEAAESERLARQKEAEERLRQKEEEAWTTARNTDSLPGYEQFVQAWPTSRYATSARQRIRELELILPTDPKQRLIIVHEHSDLFYWWIIWVFGGLCAGLTYAHGERTVLFDGARTVLFHPSALLATLFIGLVLFVGIATSVRVRGIGSVIFFSWPDRLGWHNTTSCWLGSHTCAERCSIREFGLLCLVLHCIVWCVAVCGLCRGSVNCLAYCSRHD